VRKGLLIIEEIKRSIAFDQPFLSVAEAEGGFEIAGKFLVASSSYSTSGGAIDYFDVSIIVAKDYPRTEPVVFETGNRIPREADRHCNPNGACCTGVWEEWIVKNSQPSIDLFLEGPVRNFFLSQMYFEIHGSWPFGERSHGDAGIREACADMLSVENDPELLARYLWVLSGSWPKGHWLCPCGSEQPIRYCHRDELMKLHTKLPPFIAHNLLDKLKKKTAARSKSKSCFKG
jgi:hypothetical protein